LRAGSVLCRELRLERDHRRGALPVIRRAALAALALLAGCEIFVEPSPPPGTCTSDQQCPFPQRCFVDGCGTLPDDLLAEVTTSAVTGVTSVDLPVGPARQDVPLVLPNVQVVQLSLRRGAFAYPSTVQVLASGESQLLPGVQRTIQTVGSSASGLLPV